MQTLRLSTRLHTQDESVPMDPFNHCDNPEWINAYPSSAETVPRSMSVQEYVRLRPIFFSYYTELPLQQSFLAMNQQHAESSSSPGSMVHTPEAFEVNQPSPLDDYRFVFPPSQVHSGWSYSPRAQNAGINIDTSGSYISNHAIPYPSPSSGAGRGLPQTSSPPSLADAVIPRSPGTVALLNFTNVDSSNGLHYPGSAEVFQANGQFSPRLYPFQDGSTSPLTPSNGSLQLDSDGDSQSPQNSPAVHVVSISSPECFFVFPQLISICSQGT